VSHDLRGPLNEVIAGATRLQGTYLSEEQRDLVSGIERSSRDLLEMIDDIRAFSQSPASRTGAAPAAAGSAGATKAGPRVLVADDDAVNGKVVAAMLQGLGYRVDVVANGREAVEACRRADYDVVLMDGQMPEMDGLDACARIREDQGQARRTPIVAMTAHAGADYETRCRAAGMDDYLAKPVRLQVLRDAVRKWAPLGGSVPALPDRR